MTLRRGDFVTGVERFELDLAGSEVAVTWRSYFPGKRVGAKQS